MKRRQFGLMAGASAAAIGAAAGLPTVARAGVPQAAADTLKTTLTPFGSERAGNADGSIPAWTGGLTEIQPGWTAAMQQPDYFASDAKLVTITAGNMAQYQDQLTVGAQKMLAKYPEFRMDVYPTHRTAAAPQWVYDNIYQNALNSSLAPRGGRFGFQGAFGGYAFPILDSDPNIAGPQIIWNHLTRWDGANNQAAYSTYIVSNGSVTTGGITYLKTWYPYYDQSLNVNTFAGWYEKIHLDYFAPAVDVGQVLCEWSPTLPGDNPTQAWELLNGQGRVRKAPELTYDTPTADGGGINNYDESYGFYGSPDRYNWKLVGKKEMFIPYNNNKLVPNDPFKAIQASFLDPDLVRFEKHRVYVVEATLAPGERHSIPRRTLYFDEDNWHVAAVDEYDGAGNYVKHAFCYNQNTPNLPGTIFIQQTLNNLQTGQYVVGTGLFTTPERPGVIFDTINPNLFNPQFISASAQY